MLLQDLPLGNTGTLLFHTQLSVSANEMLKEGFALILIIDQRTVTEDIFDIYYSIIISDF